MKTTKSNKTHGLFFALIAQLDGYHYSMRTELKEALVGSASGGKTDSLSVLYSDYPRAYAKMIEELKSLVNDSGNKDNKAEVWRKRCLAAVCTWLDIRNLSFESDKAKIEYAKGVICRAANCSDFNKITITRMSDVYNEFVQKQEIAKTRKEVVWDYEICEN